MLYVECYLFKFCLPILIYVYIADKRKKIIDKLLNKSTQQGCYRGETVHCKVGTHSRSTANHPWMFTKKKRYVYIHKVRIVHFFLSPGGNDLRAQSSIHFVRGSLFISRIRSGIPLTTFSIVGLDTKSTAETPPELQEQIQEPKIEFSRDLTACVGLSICRSGASL